MHIAHFDSSRRRASCSLAVLTRSGHFYLRSPASPATGSFPCCALDAEFQFNYSWHKVGLAGMGAVSQLEEATSLCCLSIFIYIYRYIYICVYIYIYIYKMGPGLLASLPQVS